MKVRSTLSIINTSASHQDLSLFPFSYLALFQNLFECGLKQTVTHLVPRTIFAKDKIAKIDMLKPISVFSRQVFERYFIIAVTIPEIRTQSRMKDKTIYFPLSCISFNIYKP